MRQLSLFGEPKEITKSELDDIREMLKTYKTRVYFRNREGKQYAKMVYTIPRDPNLPGPCWPLFIQEIEKITGIRPTVTSGGGQNRTVRLNPAEEDQF